MTRIEANLTDAAVCIALLMVESELQRKIRKNYLLNLCRLIGQKESNAIKGLDLGYLSLCKAIVEQPQGKIWVESALGQGAGFYLSCGRRTVKVDPQPSSLSTSIDPL